MGSFPKVSSLRDDGEFPEASVRWGGTLLPQAVGRAMEWPESLAWESSPEDQTGNVT